MAETREDQALAEPPALFSVETSHTGDFGGRKVDYTANVSNFLLKKDDGSVYAEAVLTSYLAGTRSGSRPVTFIFNGGPGSASTWLHMGLMGPVRVRVPSDASDPGLPPYAIEKNPMALLDLTDLVFIDPIGTGFSRLAGEGKPEDVFGLEEDARSVASIVREWLRREKRWNTPVFIAGESFGTTRSAAMLPYLQDGPEPIRVSGVIMISQAMDYTGSTPVNDNLIAFATYLPSLAATAWHHERLENRPADFSQFINTVREFTIDEYLPALVKGAYLSEQDTDRIAGLLERFTGVDKSYFLKSRLRIPTARFAKELLREQGAIVGRLDSRYRAQDVDVMAESPRFDAASAAISAAYSSSFKKYLSETLNVSLDRPYYASGPSVGQNWVYDRSEGYHEPSYVNTAPKLADAMAKNPSLQVLVASGYYDLITPFFDAEFTVARHGIDFSRVTMTYYDAGHMMYVHEPAFVQLSKDIRRFIERLLNDKQKG
ncbi:MAG: peptidase S10 [Kordiimonadaceae bacterium]|nr:peptidase S10 [Kordiimonadaceae bacterium]MBO6569306.1 peptidase S10 [Kordiimonadaceae bacterium]MBO6964782.1 peptidase S10 [Kordiimonadaceae bacterium]